MSRPKRPLIARTLRELADWVDGDAPSRIIEDMLDRGLVRDTRDPGIRFDDGTPDNPDRELDLPVDTDGWRSWAPTRRPPWPSDDGGWRITVGPNDDPNALARMLFQDRPEVDTVTLNIHGVNPHTVRIGMKNGIYRDGNLPFSVFLRGSADSEIQGIDIGDTRGYCVNLVVDDLAVRKPSGFKACIEDDGASGTWWLRKFRPRQNAEQARIYLEGLPGDHNYGGAKWAIKPSDGVKRIVAVDCPRVKDPELGIYPQWWEHYGYLTAVKRYFFDNVDMSGGNRTGMQDNTPRAYDGQAWPWVECEEAVVINCHMEVGTMWSMNSGGKALTSWQMAAGSIGIYAGNTIVSKYGGIGLAYQPVDADQYKDWPTPHNFGDRDGFVHKGDWFILDNDIHVTEGGRSALSINGAHHAVVAGNKITHNGTGPLIVVDSKTSLKNGAPRCLKTAIHIDQPGYDVMTYDGNTYVPWR